MALCIPQPRIDRAATALPDASRHLSLAAHRDNLLIVDAARRISRIFSIRRDAPRAGAARLRGRPARVCARCLARVERMPEPLCESLRRAARVRRQRSTIRRCARCLAHPPHFAQRARGRALSSHGRGRTRCLPSLIRRHKYGLDQSLARALAECLGDELPLLGRRLRCGHSGAAASRGAYGGAASTRPRCSR